MRYICTSIVATLVLAGTSFAATINVPGDYVLIQDAINASSNGDVIAIAAGTHYEARLNPAGRAITICSASGNLDVTINANGGGNVFTMANNEGGETIIKNLVITGGSANYGGGIYCNNSDPTISGCTIKVNTANNGGGGIFCENNSNPTITDCEISDNAASGYQSHGGGIGCRDSNLTITDCNIWRNTLGSDPGNGSGGGISCRGGALTITNGTINNNASYSGGGGIDCGGTILTITDCTIAGNTANTTGNTANTSGGGINTYSLSELQGSASITGCTITDNTAISGSGGGICFTGGGGGGVFGISNCTISHNIPDNVYGDSDWPPLSGEGSPSFITMENCTIFGTGEHIAGNIPILHLGENHIHDGIDDGDLDGDGDVDVDDLNLHHAAVGICQSDVNHDGDTDIMDLLWVIDGWGGVCP